jgi:glycosyltransferase involved in cell wall biosynthesis
MHILILNWRDPKNPLSGGAEFVTMEHAKAWIKKGHKVTWFCATYLGSTKEELLDGVRIVRAGNALTVFFWAWVFYRKNKQRFDLVIDQVHGIPFFAKIYSKVPVVVLVHEVAGEIWDSMYPFPFSWIGKLLESLYLFMYKSHYFWTDAPSTKKELIGLGIQQERCIVIPCPIDPTIRVGIREKENIPTCIFVSRIVPMKGLTEAIEAFSYVQLQIPNAQFWIIGNGKKSYIKNIKDSLKGKTYEKQITWWGGVDNQKKISLMGKAHVLLHASVKEGWGLVVLEAASQGTPTVAYPSGSLVDVVRNGETGLLTKSRNAQELGHLTVQLLQSQKVYKQMQNQCIVWNNAFVWRDATRQSLSFLQSVLSSNQ